MRKLIILALAFLPVLAFGQASYFSQPLNSTAFVSGIKVLTAMNAAVVQFCAAPANATPCTNYATVYTDSTATVAAANPVTADPSGNWGVWALPGQYQYTVTYQGQSFGPYNVSIGPGQSGSGSVVSSLNGIVFVPSGTDICAKLTTAYASLPTRTITDTYFNPITVPYGTLVLPSGNLTCSSSFVSNSPLVNIIGQGATATTISYTGSGTAIWLNPNSNVNEFVSRNGLRDLAIDGAGALAGAIGLRTTDFSGFVADNVIIRNFSGTGSIGWLDDTVNWYNEKMTIRMSLENNKTSWKVYSTSLTGFTFGYGVFNVAILNHSGQTGLLVAGNALFNNATVHLTINQVDNPANATGIQVQDTAQFAANTYTIEIESPNGIGTGHTINVTSSAQLPFNGVGALNAGNPESNVFPGTAPGGGSAFYNPQWPQYWPTFATGGNQAAAPNVVFRLDPNAAGQVRQNVIDVLATPTASYQTNDWPSHSGTLATLETNQSFTGTDTFAGLIVGAGAAFTSSGVGGTMASADTAQTFGALQTFGSGIKVGASGSTISDSRALVQSVNDCGSTTTCANTANNSFHEVIGTVTLSTGAATLSGITGFSTIHGCTCTDQTSAAACKAVPASASSVTFGGTGSDVLFYRCIGN